MGMDQEPLLPAVEIEPAVAARSSVIWLHGLGADGHDFEPIVPQLALPGSVAVRFVFPHAPRRKVTINNGMLMPAWFDIRAPDLSRGEDEDGIRTSSGQVMALVRRELDRGIAAERIVLAGFSQGGAIALHAGLRCPQPLAGVMVLSGYLPLPQRLAGEASAANRSTPIFAAHGSDDQVIPIGLAETSAGRLRTQGYDIDFRAYPMAHGVCGREIEDIRAWLIRVLR